MKITNATNTHTQGNALFPCTCGMNPTDFAGRKQNTGDVHSLMGALCNDVPFSRIRNLRSTIYNTLHSTHLVTNN